MRRVLVPHQHTPLAPAVGAVVHELHGLTMGSSWSAKLVAPAERNLRRLEHGIQQTLDAVVAQMSTWVPDSTLSQYNQAAAGTWHEWPRECLQVLCYALEVAQWSEGAYDPTAGPLVNVWGFGPEPKRVARPDDVTLAAAKARVGWQRVQVEKAQRRILQPGGVYLDFSAIAKGFGVDQVSRYLHSIGVDSHLVEVGGELRGAGIKPDALPWWVELERPLTLAGAAADALVQHIIALHGLSIATSGDYRKYFDTASTRYSHTVDPRSGEPIQHGVAAVTVIHRDCMTADAVSTALNVMGHEQGLAFADQYDIPALFVVRTTQGFSEYSSQEFRALLQ